MLPTPTKRTTCAAASIRATATAAPRVGASARCTRSTISSHAASACRKNVCTAISAARAASTPWPEPSTSMIVRPGAASLQRPVVAADWLARIRREHGAEQRAGTSRRGGPREARHDRAALTRTRVDRARYRRAGRPRQARCRGCRRWNSRPACSGRCRSCRCRDRARAIPVPAPSASSQLRAWMCRRRHA